MKTAIITLAVLVIICMFILIWLGNRNARIERLKLSQFRKSLKKGDIFENVYGIDFEVISVTGTSVKCFRNGGIYTKELIECYPKGGK